MKTVSRLLILLALVGSPALAHKLREKGVAATVAGSTLSVTPTRDWNRLGHSSGKRAETWTIDGEQLDDLTFFAGIEPGEPLVRERSKKKDPLPKFTATTLIAEIPELLEGTYRTYKTIGSFTTTSTEPTTFLGRPGVLFTYTYTDDDQLTRRGEARAAIVDGKLYMISFDAPRLYYYDRLIGEARAIAASARL